ncbi:MAG: DUF1036 domain-containing protein [Paracoccus sp. (in: a-proteobacteria)]|nr:DUF1036 domain-containing protein [Paracoccus sp. (in: a-proteobacteria)]
MNPVRAMMLSLPLVLGLLPGGARASLSLCNQSYDVLNIAIAMPGPQDYTTRGWWRVAPNQCAMLLRERLEAREYFIFAADVFGNEVLPGVTPMCVGTREFRIDSQQDCLLRGYLDARFYEIDPQGQESWTVFVQPRP